MVEYEYMEQPQSPAPLCSGLCFALDDDLILKKKYDIELPLINPFALDENSSTTELKGPGQQLSNDTSPREKASKSKQLKDDDAIISKSLDACSVRGDDNADTWGGVSRGVWNSMCDFNQPLAGIGSERKSTDSSETVQTPLQGYDLKGFELMDPGAYLGGDNDSHITNSKSGKDLIGNDKGWQFGMKKSGGSIGSDAGWHFGMVTEPKKEVEIYPVQKYKPDDRQNGSRTGPVNR